MKSKMNEKSIFGPDITKSPSTLGVYPTAVFTLLSASPFSLLNWSNSLRINSISDLTSAKSIGHFEAGSPFMAEWQISGQLAKKMSRAGKKEAICLFISFVGILVFFFCFLASKFFLGFYLNESKFRQENEAPPNGQKSGGRRAKPSKGALWALAPFGKDQKESVV